MTTIIILLCALVAGVVACQDAFCNYSWHNRKKPRPKMRQDRRSTGGAYIIRGENTRNVGEFGMILSAIIMKQGGSLSLSRLDILDVPFDCVIVKNEDPFGNIMVWIKGYATDQNAQSADKIHVIKGR